MTATSHASQDARAAHDALEAEVQAIARELRCLVCQNESVAGSHAPLAQDLRQRLRERLAAGATREQVVAEMVERYGDFIRYQPPLDARTLPLWAGPGLLVGGGALALWTIIRRRARLADEDFESSFPEEPGQAQGSEAPLAGQDRG